MFNEIEKLSYELHLPFIRNNYKAVIEESLNNQYSHHDFLKCILEGEIALRNQNGVNNRIRNARFPSTKLLEDLKLEMFPLEQANRIRELKNLSFIEQGRNIILVGNPGVGKTHISIGLGIKACMEKKSVLFITVPNLITELKESMTLNQLTNYKKKFISYDLVILDELGYVGFDKAGSELLFNLLSMRNESKSIIITSNLSFDRWTEVFNDPVLTSAMIDRLTHRAHVLIIQGDSYRIKETKEWLNTNK